MTLHHGKHYAGYVSKYNAATANLIAGAGAGAVTASTPLPVALSLVGSPQLAAPAGLDAAVRNQGGGAWNHALFWKTLAPPGSADAAYASAASADLKAAVDAAFGGADGLRAALAKAAAGVFGSGWAFLCATAQYYPGVGGAAGARTTGAAVSTPARSSMMPVPPPMLRVVTSPNQDSPLTGMAASGTGERCVPIMGLDVWEHGELFVFVSGLRFVCGWGLARRPAASFFRSRSLSLSHARRRPTTKQQPKQQPETTAYYLKYRNLRPAYIDAVLGNATAPGAVNWAAVSRNYALVARAGSGNGGDAALLEAAGAIGQA